MAKLQTILAALLAAAAISEAAYAQSRSSFTSQEVVGEWTLAITPAEREDLKISIQSRDGGQPDLPLTITDRGGGRLACVVNDRSAQCRMQDGALVVTSSSRSGGARMIFTLTQRTRDGFSGRARMRLRLLPVGGHIGAVRMTRR